MIGVTQALAIITAAARPKETEEVSLLSSLGRVLAREIVSDVDWPPFDTSAMDGYAVRLSDVHGTGPSLRERPKIVAAGDGPPEALCAGEAVRVMTGAPLPPGTEAVIPVERARREEGRVSFDVAPAPGAHIRRRRESIARGARLIPSGRRLSAGDVALAALAGADPLPVFSQPRVAIAVTGNELVAAAETPRPGQLRDSNGPMLLSLCQARGWPTRLLPPVADESSGVERLFASAGEEDVLVTSGGVSAGDLDLLPTIAQRCGFEILFDGVSVRPGKPIVFARRGKVFWFGLPGNPVSSSVGFHLFVREAIDRLEGDANPGAPRIRARLFQGVKATGPRETYRDALWRIEEGESRVEALHSVGSHDIAAHARANVLIRVPPNCGQLAAGEIVTCLVL